MNGNGRAWTREGTRGSVCAGRASAAAPFGRPQHRLPPRRRLRLILHGDGPDVDAVAGVRGDPLGEVLRPRPLHGRQQPRRLRRGQHRLDLAANVPVVDGPFHPSGRRPRRCDEAEGKAARLGGALRRADHRDHPGLHVVRDRHVEVLQADVPRDVVKGVRRRREVARVYGDTSERVAEAALFRRTKVSIDHLLLPLRRQLPPVDRRRLCECAAKPDILLEALCAIQHQRGALGCARRGLHFQWRHVLEQHERTIPVPRRLRPLDAAERRRRRKSGEPDIHHANIWPQGAPHRHTNTRSGSFPTDEG